MDENIKYKKCPYCEINYIPMSEYCCQICYENCSHARQEIISQRNKQYELARKKELEMQRIQEYNNRNELLKLWKSFNFIGFMHTTNFENFVRIYKSKCLKSRNQLINEGFIFEDNAETVILEHTSVFIKSKVRFYYRPITPTNISAYMQHNQQNPVLITFDEKLIFERGVLFCDGGASSHFTTITNTAKKALGFKWPEIFSVGKFNSDDLVLKNHRNAEFLTNSPISLEKANKFYFKNYNDYAVACELFENDIRFEHNPKLFY